MADALLVCRFKININKNDILNYQKGNWNGVGFPFPNGGVQDVLQTFYPSLSIL
jgi:hypothetical protein